jgi:CheY-like chemotaxis protein/GNAT superfamily N-acetyltransferase
MGAADLALGDRSLSSNVQSCLQDITRASAQAADPTQLERVVLNLIVNARDALDGRGKIEVGSRTETFTAGEHGLPDGRYVGIWVRDNGRGMDDEVRRRIFEPFFTTKEAGRGTGIGMALVQGFVIDAAGAVEIESTLGKGTTVTLHLPEASRDSQRPSAPERAPRGRARKAEGLSILLVEDNPDVLATTTRILRAAGFDVVQAEDGDRALDLVDAPHTELDLLCIDGVIPGAPSARVIERVRARRPSTPVIVCSGYVDEELLHRGIRTGEIACVRKPYTSEQLLDCVRSELGID